MPGLSPGPAGKTAPVCPGSPEVSTRDPSGYTALKPQSSVFVDASGAAGFGVGVLSRSNERLCCRPPGYWCCCATITSPLADTEWHEMHGPVGDVPWIVRNGEGFAAPGWMTMTAPLLPTCGDVYVL